MKKFKFLAGFSHSYAHAHKLNRNLPFSGILFMSLISISCNKNSNPVLVSPANPKVGFSETRAALNSPFLQSQTSDHAGTGATTANYEEEVKKHTGKKDGDPDFRQEIIHGVPTLVLVEGSEAHPICPITLLKAGTKLYHWGDSTKVDRVDHEGNVSPEWLDNYVNTQEVFQQGGGMYFSTSPFNTQNYGTNLIVLEAPIDLHIVPSDLFQNDPRIMPKNIKYGSETDKRDHLNSLNRGLRHIGIHGLFDGFEGQGFVGFFSIIHPDATRNVRAHSHPWFTTDPVAMTKMLRGEQLTAHDKSQISGIIDEVLRETIVESKDIGIENMGPVKTIVSEYHPNLSHLLKVEFQHLQEKASPVELKQFKRRFFERLGFDEHNL